MEPADEPANSVSRINPDLTQLSGVISPTTLPNPEESANFMKELTFLKNLNAERDHLQLLDTIIDMTEKGQIGHNPLNKCIPDSIIVLHREGLDAYEYINAQITKKWIDYKFQTDSSQLEISVRTPHLVQITNKAKGCFDVMGLLVRHTPKFIRNRISPEYYAKNERLVPEPPAVVADYSAFRGNYSVVKRSAPPPAVDQSSLVKVFPLICVIVCNFFRQFLKCMKLSMGHFFRLRVKNFCHTLTVYMLLKIFL